MNRTCVLLMSLALCGLIVQDGAAQRWRFRYGPPGYGPECRGHGYYRPHPGWTTPAYGPDYGPSDCVCQDVLSPSDTEQQPQQPARPSRPYLQPLPPTGSGPSAGMSTRPALKPIPMPGTETKVAPTPLTPQTTRDIKATLAAQGELSEVLKYAKIAGAYDLLDNPGPFTVFAPTDRAFRALEPGLLARLTAAPDKLKEVLLYHALAEKLPLAKAEKQGSAKSVLGPDVRFRAEGGRVFVNDAQIIGSDVPCTNGVLHTIDKVLFPPGFKLPEAAAATKKAAEKPGQKAP